MNWKQVAQEADLVAVAAERLRKRALELQKKAKEAAAPPKTKGGGVALSQRRAREFHEQLGEIQQELAAALGNLGTQLDLPPPSTPVISGIEDAPPGTKGLKAATPTAERGAEDSGAPRNDFGTFLGMIGGSVVDAQRQLDQRSREYLAGQGGASPALPTVFRIPKLTADIRFALETEGSKSLNLVLFGTRDSRREEHQQSMSVEVVAVPPPPEMLQQLASSRPAARLVLNPAERDALHQELSAIEEPASELEMDRLVREMGWDETLILLLPTEEPDGSEACILARVNDAEPGEWRVWQMFPGNPDSLTPCHRVALTTPSEAATDPLQILLLAFTKRQSKFLGQIRGGG